MLATIVDSSGGIVEIPPGFDQLENFRAWVRTLGDDGPRVHYSHGSVWIDMSPQDYFRHLYPVAAINARLTLLANDLDLGRYHPDGGWLTNERVGLSTEPDGFLVLWETFASGAARWAKRDGDKGPIELLGRGDMVLEVVSDTSEQKDLVDLLRDYAEAGFSEYWLVDVRGDELKFQVLCINDHGRYQPATPDAQGWVESRVWSRWFKLERHADRLGEPRYDLRVR